MLAACSSEGAVGRDNHGGDTPDGSALDPGASGPEIPGGNPSPSAGGVIDAGGVADIPCTDTCDRGLRCFGGHCIPDNGPCDAAMPCANNDTACVEGVCVPYGVDPLGDRDPSCQRAPDPLAEFVPEVQCEWPGKFSVEYPDDAGVRVPPLVADVDGDEVPEILFVSSAYPGGSSPWPARIRAIRGDDCSPVWTSSQSQDFNGSLALGDVDGDGKYELCGRGNTYDGNCTPFCLSAEDGSLRWEGSDPGGQRVRVGCAPNALYDAGIAIANVDETGGVEVVVGLNVFDGKTGVMKHPAVRVTPDMGPPSWNSFLGAIADVDDDGHAEVLTGAGVYDLVDGTVDDDWGSAVGYTALADMAADFDGPEVVVISPALGEARVHALDGALLYTHAIPGGIGGAPTIADLDGDGQAEFSTAGRGKLVAFDLDCGVLVRAGGTCPSGSTDGVLWTSDTFETSSGVTGSTVFDFEGDGPVEVVYADQCWARVYDGATGTIRFSAAHESSTGIEYPAVADVDGDYYTEIVVPHEKMEGCPATDPLVPTTVREPGRRYQGVSVYRDRDDRWASSRSVWNQHTYHVSNIADDGTIPAVEPDSWSDHNSYRRQLPAAGMGALGIPDLTLGPVAGPPCDQDAHEQVIEVDVCNRGLKPVAAGVKVKLTRDEKDGDELCDLDTTKDLAAGKCETLSCTWDDVPLNTEHEVWAEVDLNDAVAECLEDNNRGVGVVRCPPAEVQ